MRREERIKLEDGSLVPVSQGITVPIAEWQALKKRVEEGTLYNTEEIITESGTWTAPVTGDYLVTVIDGGAGAYVLKNYVSSGATGRCSQNFVHLVAGEKIPVTIGAAGVAVLKPDSGVWNAGDSASRVGGATVFGDITSTTGRNWQRGEDVQTVQMSALSGFDLICNSLLIFHCFYGSSGRGHMFVASGVVDSSKVYAIPGQQGAVIINYYSHTKSRLKK